MQEIERLLKVNHDLQQQVAQKVRAGESKNVCLGPKGSKGQNSGIQHDNKIPIVWIFLLGQ